MHPSTTFPGVLTGVLLLTSATLAEVTVWSGDNLTYRADTSTPKWTGQIEFRGQTMPMYGMLWNNQFIGEFQDPASRQSFSYQAAIDGDVLVLRTGKTSYRLTRQAAAPVAPRPIQGADPSVGGTRPAVGAVSGIRLHPVEMIDQARNGQVVATFLAPADWKMESGVLWRVHHLFPASPWCILKGPNGVDSYYQYPSLPFCDGVREFAMNNAAIQNEYWRQQAAQQVPEGGLYQNCEVRQRPESPAAALKDFILARFRPDLAKTKVAILKVIELPSLAKLALDEMNRNGAQGNVAAVTRIRLGYDMDGVAVEEDFFVQYSMQPMGMGGIVSWQLYCTSFRSKKGELDQNLRIYQVMSRTAKLNPQWVAAQASACQIFLEGSRQNIIRIEQMNQMIREANDHISDLHRKIVDERWQSNQRIADERGKLLKGVEWYTDPYENKRVELPSGFKHVFANRKNEYILTDDPNYDPAIAEQADWRKVPIERQ